MSNNENIKTKLKEDFEKIIKEAKEKFESINEPQNNDLDEYHFILDSFDKILKNPKSTFFALGDNFNSFFKKILEKTIYLNIPFYQRSYCWNEENWDALYSDIDKQYRDNKDKNNKKEYHFGDICILNNNSKNEFKIIDGQQRITTSIILLTVIQDYYYKLTNQSLDLGINLKKIKELYTNSFDDKAKDYLNKILDDYNDKIVLLESKKNTNNFYKCYLYFYYKFNEINDEEEQKKQKIKNYADILLNSFFFVLKEFNGCKYSKKDEMELFDNINSKGKILTLSEITKIYIFNLLSKDVLDKEAIDSEINKYNDIFKNSQKDNDDFYLVLATFFEGKLIKNNSTTRYEKIKKTIENICEIVDSKQNDLNKDELNKVINEIEIYYKAYIFIKNFKSKDKKNDCNIFYKLEIYQILEIISDKNEWLKIIYFVIFFFIFEFKDKFNNVLSFNREELKKIKILFLKISIFLFVRQLISKQGDSQIRKKVINFFGGLKDKKDFVENPNKIDYLLNEFTVEFEINEELKNKFKKEMIDCSFTNNLATICLRLISLFMNNYLENFAESCFETSKNITLEHIMFKDVKNELRNNKNIKLNEEEFKKQHNIYVNTIGNMLLLTNTINSKINDCDFKTKLEEYQKNTNKSQLFQNENDAIDISRKQEWTFENIKSRSEALCDYFINEIICKFYNKNK